MELDLSAYADRVPVEMLGGSAFPPVGQLPYLLTLPPVRLLLVPARIRGADAGLAQPAPEPLPEYTTLVIRHGLEELLTNPARTVLERDVLPAYLPKRRWFGAKDEPLRQVRIAEAVIAAGTGAASAADAGRGADAARQRALSAADRVRQRRRAVDGPPAATGAWHACDAGAPSAS